MVSPSASRALTVTAIVDGVPVLTLLGFKVTEKPTTTPLKVTLTAFAWSMTMLAVVVPAESRFPVAFWLS